MKKAFSLLAAVALFAVVAVPAPAGAATIDELQAQVAALMAQIQSLTGSTSVVGPSADADMCGVSFTQALRTGSTGAEVTNVQKVMVRKGFLVMPAGVAYGYYGKLTANAVSAYQASKMLPQVGVVGPLTRAELNADAAAMCAPVPGTPGTTLPAGCTSTVGWSPTTGQKCSETGDTSTGALEGGAGSIDEAKFIGNLNNEEVGEGQDDVEVMGLEIKPENSDIALAAVRLTFKKDNTTSGATRFSKYADEVSVSLDGKEIARIDADDFSKDNTGEYSKTLSFKGGAVIREGEVGKLVVSVSGLSNIDSNDAGQIWGVKFSDLRFEDAQGAIITTSSPNDLDVLRKFSFESFATATDLDFKVMSGDSSINSARTIEVSSTTRTTNEKVLSFKVKTGGSDMNLDELTINVNSSADLNKVVSTAYLYMDGDSVGSESSLTSSSTDAKIIFDSLDLDLDADKTYEFEVRFDLNKADGSSSNYSSGATVKVTVDSTEVKNSWIIEDENGDNVVAGDRSGSASADAHTLRTTGLQVSTGSVSVKEVYNSTTPANSYGEYRMEVKVTAIGDTLYLAETATTSTSSVSHGLTFYYEGSDGLPYTAGTSTGSFSRKSGGTFENGFVRVDEGQTVTFEFLGTLDPAASGQYRAQLYSVGYNTTAVTPNAVVKLSPVNDYRSSLQTISN